MFRNLLITAVGAALLSGCGGMANVDVQELEESEALVQELVEPRNLETTRLYFGEPNRVSVSDENPGAYGLFELVPGARILIRVANTQPEFVGFKFYRVKPNGKLALYAIVEGWESVAVGFRTAPGGSYLVESFGSPSPAHLEVQLICRSGHCAPTQQVGETCAGIANLGCDEGLRCSFAAYTCTLPDASGTCELPSAFPLQCAPPNPEITQPVCGCDGLSYVDRCHARAAGASIASDGPCAPVSCQPQCLNIGTRSEGWYDGCTGELINWSFCGGCVAECSEVGSQSEGWYSSCGEPIRWERCG